MIGDVVHRVLEAIVEQALPRETQALEDATDAIPVPWPEPEVLEGLLRRVAADRVRQEGLGPPSFARVLVETARPLVQADDRVTDRRDPVARHPLQEAEPGPRPPASKPNDAHSDLVH